MEGTQRRCRDRGRKNEKFDSQKERETRREQVAFSLTVRPRGWEKRGEKSNREKGAKMSRNRADARRLRAAPTKKLLRAEGDSGKLKKKCWGVRPRPRRKKGGKVSS